MSKLFARSMPTAIITILILTAASADAGRRIHVGDTGTVIDTGSHLAYLHGGTPCANTLADEKTMENPSFASTPEKVLAINTVLAPGTNVVVVGSANIGGGSVPIHLRVKSGARAGATCWVESDGESVYPVRFDFEKKH